MDKVEQHWNYMVSLSSVSTSLTLGTFFFFHFYKFLFSQSGDMPRGKMLNAPDLENFSVSKLRVCLFFNLSWQDTEIEFVYECESLKILVYTCFSSMGLYFSF